MIEALDHTEKEPMRITALSIILRCLAVSNVAAQRPTLTELLSRDVAGMPGKEITIGRVRPRWVILRQTMKNRNHDVAGARMAG